MSKKKREFKYDVMRALAAFSVVVIHVCAMQWRELSVESAGWAILTIWDMLCKFGPPLFFMISGRFFLSEEHEYSVKEILTKKIPRLAAAFLAWSSVYTVINIIRVDSLRESWKWIFIEFFTGEYHMWFLFAIAGLYLITPLLKPLVSRDKYCRYFLMLFLMFQLLLPFLAKLPMIRAFVMPIQEKMQMHYVLGFTGYYILGYFLNKHTFSVKTRYVCYVLGLLGASFSIIATLAVSRDTGVANETYAEYLTWNVAAESVAVYIGVQQLAAQYTGLENTKFAYGIGIIAKYSFGIYLAHPLFLWVFNWLGFLPDIFTPVLSVPVISAIAMLLSFLLSWILRKLPVVGKLIT